MDKADQRRGKVTPENKEEARLLTLIWNKTKAERKLANLATQEAFGEKYEIGNQAAVSQFLNGTTALSASAARAFATGLGCKVADFSPRLAKLLDPELPVPPDPEGRAKLLVSNYLALSPSRQRTLFAMAETLNGPGGDALVQLLQTLATAQQPTTTPSDSPGTPAG